MRYRPNLIELLIKLYPTPFQREFGEQMRQTFQDQQQDLRQQQGYLPLSYWLVVIADEVRGAAREHLDRLLSDPSLRHRLLSRAITAMLLFIPLFVLSYSALVTLALTLPHPPISGSGVLLALSGLLIVATALSGAACRALLTYFTAERRSRLA